MKTPVVYLQDRLVAALARVPVALRGRPLSLQTTAKLRFFVHSLFSALFIACLIHTWPALVLPVDLPLRTIIGNVASWMPSPETSPGTSAPLRDLALIKLDSERFRRTYHGNSPLDRCELLQDLRGLLVSTTLQLLAIDLDLSPSTQRAMLTRPEDPRSCDAQLDQLMIDNARRVLLILPLDRDRLRAEPETAEAAERVAQKAWLKKMKDGQVEFARPELDVQFGMVRHHLLQLEPQPSPELKPRPEPGLGVATAQAICALDRANPSLKRYCADVQALRRANEGDARQISLHVLVNQLPLGNRLPLDGQTGTVLDKRKIRYALLGAGYSPDDEPLTPIGRLAGVEVHAAIAANPNEAASHWLDLALDLLLGVGFAYGVQYFWQHYFDQRRAVTAQQVSGLGHPLLAYRWLVGLVISSLLLLPLLGLASTWALATHGWWISPAGMLVGVLIDAFVVGGVHNAEHLLLVTVPAQAAELGALDSPAYWAGWQGLYRVPLAWLPSLVWLAVLLLAVRQLAH